MALPYYPVPRVTHISSASWDSRAETRRDSIGHIVNHSIIPFKANPRANTQQQTFARSLPYKHLAPPMPIFPMEFIYRPSRYYASTLSESDVQALAIGEKNRNLKEWSANDLIMHHESRKELLPRIMPKVDKTNALAGIEHDKQCVRRVLTRETSKVRRFLRFLGAKGSADSVENQDVSSSTTQQQQQQQTPTSTHNLLTPSPLYEPEDLTLLPQPRPAHICAASSSSDYFSHRPSSYHPQRSTLRSHIRRISPLASSSSSYSGTLTADSSPRVRSPLAREIQFRHNPDVTFDAFLVPHKSGKGEAFCGAVNAMRVEDIGAGTGKGRGKVRKVPSMPVLRQRGGFE